MVKYILLVACVLSAEVAFNQTFLDSYKTYCEHRINFSIVQRVKMASDTRTVTSAKVNAWHQQLNNRLVQQVERINAVLKAYSKKTGVDLNKADSLTIIFRTTSTSSFANYIIWSGKDTMKSNGLFALTREINNGGGRLELVKKDATKFTIHKTYHKNIREPFLALATRTDTAYAYQADVYSPVELGNHSIILMVKKVNRIYKIHAYHLHQFALVVVDKE
jgi:hypothetical protein